MSGFAAIPGAAREAEDADLLALAVPHHLRGDLRAFDGRFPGLDVLAVGREQHTVEGDLAPRLDREQRHLDGDPFFGPELLAACRKYGVRHRARNLNKGKWLVKRRRIVQSRLGPRALPSSGTRRAASSGRRAPRARVPSASPT